MPKSAANGRRFRQERDAERQPRKRQQGKKKQTRKKSD